MKYIRWFLYVIADFAFTILCYFTNPIVVLFADERGRLPKIFKLWQTYDNTLDVGWMVTEGIVPKIFRYNYNSHYYYVYEDKSKYPCEPGKVYIVNPNFTLWERVQRYFCRLWWLYRNTGYGFSYYVCGKEYNPQNIIALKDYKDTKYNECHHYEIKDSYLWRFYYTKPWFWKFYLRIYFGWKLNHSEMTLDKAMIAFFINPFRMIKEDE